MSTTFENFSASSQVFVPRGVQQNQDISNSQNFTSAMQKADSFSSQAGCYYAGNSNMHV